MDINTAAGLAQVGSVAASILIGTYAVWRKLEKRDVDLHLKTELMADRLERIEHQFGPNGGGLRQAVNEMNHKIDKIETRVDTISEDLAELRGKFEQHDKSSN
jgi:uncharacterized protein Yka (UPF0111/DUF47 family)